MDVPDHARVHLKQLGEKEYVLYHTVPSARGANHPPTEDHLLILTDLDLRQILSEASFVTLPMLPVPKVEPEPAKVETPEPVAF